MSKSILEPVDVPEGFRPLVESWQSLLSVGEAAGSYKRTVIHTESWLIFVRQEFSQDMSKETRTWLLAGILSSKITFDIKRLLALLLVLIISNKKMRDKFERRILIVFFISPLFFW